MYFELLYVSCIQFSSWVLQIVFQVWISRKVCTTKNLVFPCSTCESLEIRLLYYRLSSRKPRENPLRVFYRSSHKYSNDQQLSIYLIKLVRREKQDYAPLQHLATNNVTNSHKFKNTQWLSSSYKSEQR